MTDAVQNGTIWRPKPKQRAVLEAAQKAGIDRSITAVCEDAGVPRTTFYRWLDNDAGFGAAWNGVWHGAIERHMPTIVSAMIMKARKGDTAAARLIAELAGVMKQVVEHQGDVVIQVRRSNASD